MPLRERFDIYFRKKVVACLKFHFNQQNTFWTKLTWITTEFGDSYISRIYFYLIHFILFHEQKYAEFKNLSVKNE